MTPSTDDPAIPSATPARDSDDRYVIALVWIGCIAMCLSIYAAAFRLGMWIWGSP